jgi:hypothetical protein
MRELEDFDWFPQAFRQHQMDFLSLLALKFNLYQPVKKILFDILDSQNTKDWTDACSGSGGPVQSLAGKHPVLLTDLYPSFARLQLPANLQYLAEPVDITKNLPPGNGLITLFNSFHHFTPEQQSHLINQCSEANRSLIAVEVLQPGLRSFVSVVFTTTIGHWLLVPFMKPFSLKRLFFTYLVPLHTLSVLYDGIVSVFKSKSSRYFEAFAKRHTTGNYRVDFVKIKGRFGPLFMIKGLPATQ